MSSWSSGRIHFREKKPVITPVHVPTNNVSNNIIINDKPPSKFVFSKNSNNVDVVI